MDGRMPLAIEATGLVKCFGETRAVDGVDLAVRRGSVYGVLGPNGAGKTTTVRMLATLLRPDAGSARVLGHDVVAEADAVRGLVSLTGQLASVDEDLTGRENLILIGRLLGLKRAAAKARAAELLDAFGIADAAGKLVKHNSGGMRRRLDIAASIVVTPELMFLDEPTTGLDPQSRRAIWEICERFLDGGGTILLTTHFMDEAERLSDRVAIMDLGEILIEGTPSDLIHTLGGSNIIEWETSVPLPDEELRVLPGVQTAGRRGTIHHLTTDELHRSLPALTELVARRGGTLSSLRTQRATLDDVFLARTGRQLRDD
jgi:ABC-2 type transport system ATP-binding protein